VVTARAVGDAGHGSRWLYMSCVRSRRTPCSPSSLDPTQLIHAAICCRDRHHQRVVFVSQRQSKVPRRTVQVGAVTAATAVCKAKSDPQRRSLLHLLACTVAALPRMSEYANLLAPSGDTSLPVKTCKPNLSSHVTKGMFTGHFLLLKIGGAIATCR